MQEGLQRVFLFVALCHSSTCDVNHDRQNSFNQICRTYEKKSIFKRKYLATPNTCIAVYLWVQIETVSADMIK